jgi:hypothetical protein
MTTFTSTTTSTTTTTTPAHAALMQRSWSGSSGTQGLKDGDGRG